jgi:hypothetical protein
LDCNLKGFEKDYLPFGISKQCCAFGKFEEKEIHFGTRFNLSSLQREFHFKLKRLTAQISIPYAQPNLITLFVMTNCIAILASPLGRVQSVGHGA